MYMMRSIRKRCSGSRQTKYAWIEVKRGMACPKLPVQQLPGSPCLISQHSLAPRAPVLASCDSGEGSSNAVNVDDLCGSQQTIQADLCICCVRPGKGVQGRVRPNMLDESEERHGMPQAACTALVPERGNDLMQREDSFSKGAVTSCTNNFCRGYLTADSTCN